MLNLPETIRLQPLLAALAALYEVMVAGRDGCQVGAA
jgi:hypothetical protein